MRAGLFETSLQKPAFEGSVPPVGFADFFTQLAVGDTVSVSRQLPDLTGVLTINGFEPDLSGLSEAIRLAIGILRAPQSAKGPRELRTAERFH